MEQNARSPYVTDRVIGTFSSMPAERRPGLALRYWIRSWRYWGAGPCSVLYTSSVTLYCIRDVIGSQWSSRRTGVIWSYLRVPQGCASSCKIFESISSAIKWILVCKLGVTNVVKVLDDFFFVGRTKQQCQDALDKFVYISQQLGIPIATHKTVGPTQVITFLGIELDTKHMIARLPIDKLNRYRDQILTIAKQNKVTLKEIKSITGMLQFATTVITSGRPFLRRLYDMTMLATKPHHYIRLTQQLKLDLDVWLHFLQHYNGKTFIHQQLITDSTTAHFYSDASKTAFGATYGKHWIQGQWPANWQLEDITVFELYTPYSSRYTFSNAT